MDWVPLGALQVLVGTLLLIFGMQWLRKAVLRASGRKSKHDEDLIFQKEVNELSGEAAVAGFDWNGFVVSFKGVFTRRTRGRLYRAHLWRQRGTIRSQHRRCGIGIRLGCGNWHLIHRPLSRVPENAMKFAVGLALVTFGTFWGGEGVGVEWVLGDAMLLVLLAFYGGVAALLVRYLRLPAGGDTGLVAGVVE